MAYFLQRQIWKTAGMQLAQPFEGTSLRMEASKRSSESGQIGIMILLIMVVLLTIGISVASQSTQDLFLSQQQVESTRVFNAAEAGIEQALSGDLDFEGERLTGSIENVNSSNVDVSYSIEKVNELEIKLFEMVGTKINVEGSSAGNTLLVRWSRENDCGTGDVASLLVSTYIQDGTSIYAQHDAYAGCPQGDNFTTASNVNQNGYRRRVNITLPANAQFVRITPLYADTDLLVTGGNWTMPVQSYQIRSEAENRLGDEFRAVEVSRTLDSTPSVLDFSLLSGGTISK